jgi:hypothetical protein
MTKEEKRLYDQGYRRTHRDLLKMRSRQKHLRRAYGLTEDEFVSLLDSQGGVCASCGTSDWAKCRYGIPAVDHDHQTGRVRGILCDACNKAAGLLGDNPERAASLAAYLKKQHGLARVKVKVIQ